MTKNKTPSRSAAVSPAYLRLPRLYDALPVVLAGFALAFFFTQGIPLWNDDYSQWIPQAQGSLVTLVARLLLPVTWEPASWGYGDRPAEVLVYKILHGLFGDWGTGYFFVKSLGLGALLWMMREWTRRLQIRDAVTWAALAVFALSANVVASLIWHSDFGVWAQLLLAWVLLQGVTELKTLPVPASIPAGFAQPRFRRVFIAFFCAVYFGAKLRGDLRLAPVILGIHLYFYDRKRLRALWPWLAATLAATLPWSVTMFKHLPPFLGGVGYEGWTYGRYSLARALAFFGGDTFTWRSAPLSVLGALGVLALIPAAAGLAARAGKGTVPAAPGRETGLLWIWLGVATLALGAVSPQNPTFELRYTLLPLVPAALLLALGLETTLREFAHVRHFTAALLAIVALQGLLQARHAIQHRIDFGHTITGIDGVFAAVEAKHPDAQFLLGPGFLNYGYRESSSSALRGRRAIADYSELAAFPAQNTYMASWTSTLDARFSVDTVASGCGPALFDHIFTCEPMQSAFLLRYVGNPPELAQADTLDKRGDLRGARQTLQNYWERDPNNHGAGFILGLYNYRLGDYAAMERVYDVFAPYFQGHASVVYNWALAKSGVQKFADASRLFERALNLAPGDYGIGFNLADTYYKLGKRSRALATVNELLRAYPQNEALTRAKQQYSSDAPAAGH